MSITFLDPTYPARLPSRNETVDFTVVDTDPDAIVVSMKLPNGRMETIYQDGIVNTKDYTVVRDGTEDRTFHISRNVGWPAGLFDLPITEPPEPTPPPSGGQPWGIIYDVDFTSLPSSSNMSAVGSYTIDGLTWWRKNAFAGTQTFQVVNGTGLRIQDNSGSLGGFTGPRLCLPFANVPGFNSAAPYQVWVHQESNVINSACFAGIINAPADATNITAATHEPSHIGIGPTTTGASNNWLLTRAGANTNVNGPQVNVGFTNCEHGVYVVTETFDAVMMGNTYASGPVPVNSPFTYAVSQTLNRGSARTSPLIILTPSFLAHSIFKRLTVLQPKVP